MPLEYLEDVLKAYVRFPQLGIEKIAEAVFAYHGNIHQVVKALGDAAGRRVNFASEEWVAGVGSRLMWMWLVTGLGMGMQG